MPNTTPMDVKAQNGDQEINGADGDDALRGGAGADNIAGGAGNDMISGGSGNDILSGGQGDDIIRGGADDDIINGGVGFDRAVYQGALSDYSGFVDSLGRLIINDTVTGRDGNDRVRNVEEFNFGGTIYTYQQVIDFF
jgi:Ca2+-binding RTX toxin-like protein